MLPTIPYPTLCLLLWLLLLPFASYSVAAPIQVTVDRNPVNLNDSFQIIFTATEDPDDDPDFSPLQKDFSILYQNQGSNASWVNGQTSKTIQWTLTVMAKKAGNLEIPAIRFGNDVTAPLSLQVEQGTGKADLDTDKEVFLKVETSPDEAYIQSQIVYTLRVYTRVNITRAQLSEPELADAVIEKLGEDSNYNTQINGVAYSVTERKYAIFPQKSGVLTIKPLVLTADVLSSNRAVFNDFFNSPLSKTKRVMSPAVTLNVKPAPATFTGHHWLPAEQLELTQAWSGDVANMKVGEPLTRTLTLKAKGVTVGQLPELNTNNNLDTLKIYPDQPVLKEAKNGDGLTALREEKNALIPSKAGRYTLPAISIPWFNTQSQKMEVANIPETTITVVASADSPASPAPSLPPSVNLSPVEETPATIVAENAGPSTDFWPALALLLALGWLATWVYFLRNRPAPQNFPDEASVAREIRLKETVKRLKKACAENDALAAKTALLDWGRQQHQASSLGAIATCCEARLRDEILSLNQVLYGKNTGQWQGKRLFQTFTENHARAKLAGKEDNGLAPLHRI